MHNSILPSNSSDLHSLRKQPFKKYTDDGDWVMLLIVRAERKICFTTQASFPWEIKPVPGGVTKCRLFFQAIFKMDTSLQNIRRVGSSLGANSPI